MGRRYDHPNAIVRRYASARGVATANGTNAPLMVPGKSKLIAVHAHVAVAGTNVANHAYTIRNGTTSIGAIAPGTSAVGAILVSTVNTVLAANAILNCLKGTDATGIVDFTYEYEVLPDAVLTGD